MLNSLEERLHTRVVGTDWFPAGGRILVAVSGGADSVALLCLLQALADRCSWTLEVAHLDHALRKESAGDADFVVKLAGSFGLPVHLERVDVKAYAEAHGLGLEEAGRELRRDFLLRVASLRGCARIALGHHQDDQAETFLLRLLRGSGPSGLAAMRPLAGPFVRPLLTFRREELVAYLAERQLPWREDHSNRDPSFLRNRVRHDLLPLLQDYNPRVTERLTDLCDILRSEEEFWQQQAAAALAACRLEGADGCRISRPGLLALHPALAARVVRLALEQVRGDLRRLTMAHISAILDLARSPVPQSELCLPQAWVGRRYDSLWLRRAAPPAAAPVRIELPGPGAYPLPDGRRLLVELDARGAGDSRDCVEFNAAAVTFPLIVRPWLPGDRFRPAGMSGSKKLQDLYVDAKLTREERAAQLLVVAGEDVLWLIGRRRSAMAWPQGPDEAVLRLTVVAGE